MDTDEKCPPRPDAAATGGAAPDAGKTRDESWLDLIDDLPLVIMGLPLLLLDLPPYLFPCVVLPTLYWWGSFSGPFRWLVDLEIRYFGGYWEWPTVPVLILALGVLAKGVEKLAPGDAPWTTHRPLVCALLLAAGLAALLPAQRQARYAWQMPRANAPLQVVDLARLGNATPPVGHMRLLGVPAQDRRVLLRSWDRGRFILPDEVRNHNAFAPMAGHGMAAPAAPLRLLVGWYDRPEMIGDDPEGVLLADPLSNRERYKLRAAGLPLAEHVAVLFTPDAFRRRFTAWAAATGWALLAGSLWLLAWTIGRKPRNRGERRVEASPVAHIGSTNFQDLMAALPEFAQKAFHFSP